MNRNTWKVVSKTPVFKKIEDRYKQTVEMPELENRKKVLQSLWDLHQHIDFAEIEREQREWEWEIQEKVQRLKEEREEEMKRWKESYDPSKYRTMRLEEII